MINIRPALERRNISITKICARAGITSGTVRKWRLGDMKPSAQSREAMARALAELAGITVNQAHTELFGEYCLSLTLTGHTAARLRAIAANYGETVDEAVARLVWEAQ